MTGDAILEVKNVSKIYYVRRRGSFRTTPIAAVKDVSLAVPRGGVVGIVGASGSGKTTLSKILLGLEAPTSGEVLLAGRATRDLSRLEMAALVQPIFQDPYLSLNPRKTVSSIISLPLRVRGSDVTAEIARKVTDIMELTGLPRRLAGAYPSQLSGGQRQRVAIARALVARPQVVVCDEPTSALDVSVQAQILNLLQDLRRELGLTYVLISHNLAVVEHLADEVLVMNQGEVVERGSVDDVFARPAHPYTRMLLASVLTPDPSLGLPDLVPG